MLRNAASKVMWVGRATVFLVGLAVILALVLGVASTVSAHTGNKGFFHLGHKNVASAVSTLVKQGPGPALNLVVGTGQPPLQVNASAGKATNLNADKLDGLDQSAFLRSTGKAADADKLDGKDSTEFYAAGSKVADSVHADNADTVDGKHAADFAATAHSHDDRYYTEAESDGRYLGKTQKAADSDKLDGLDSTQFVQGKGQALHGARAVPQNSGGYFTVLTTQTPNLLVGYTCPADLTANGWLVFINQSSETMNVFSDNGSTNPNDYRQLAPNGGRVDQLAAASGEHVTFQVQGTNVATIEVFTVHRTNDCHTQAQALITRG